MASSERSISCSEVLSHGTASDCWLVLNDKAFDLSDFAPDHTGGAKNKFKRHDKGMKSS